MVKIQIQILEKVPLIDQTFHLFKNHVPVLFSILVRQLVYLHVPLQCHVTNLPLHNNNRPKDVETKDEVVEERRGNSSTSSSNHYVEDPQLSRSPTSICSAASSVFTCSPQRTLQETSSPPPPPPPPPRPHSDSQSFTSDHAPEQSHSRTQYGGIPLANVNEVIDLEDPTNDDFNGSGIHLQSHDPPAFMSRDSRSPTLVPNQQELELREYQQSRGESSALSDDVSLSRYERNTESPATADSRSTPSSGYHSRQNVSPIWYQKNCHGHKTDGQPVTTISLVPVPLNVTHVVLHHVTRTCSASQLPACHDIGTSNVINVQPASPRLSEDRDDMDRTRGSREAMSARSREHLHLTLNGTRSFHHPLTELRTVVPNEVLSPNRRHSDPSPLSGSPREQHGLQGEQYNRQDTQTFSEEDTSIL